MTKAIYVGVTEGAQRTEIPNGQHDAVCYQIIQLGAQKFGKDGCEWYSPQVLIGFEFPGITYTVPDTGEMIPVIKSGIYFLTLNPSKSGQLGLREIVDGFRGGNDWSEKELAQFDISMMLGRSCVVDVASMESKGRIYSNIIALSSSQKQLDLHRKPVLVTVDDFRDAGVMNSLPEWIVSKIQQSREMLETAPTPIHHHNIARCKDRAVNEQVAQNKVPTTTPPSNPQESITADDEVNVDDVPFG